MRYEVNDKLSDWEESRESVDYVSLKTHKLFVRIGEQLQGDLKHSVKKLKAPNGFNLELRIVAFSEDDFKSRFDYLKQVLEPSDLAKVKHAFKDHL